MNKILVVEDNEDVNSMICESLNNGGYSTESSYDGMDALKKIKNNKYNLILLDIMIPYKSGDMVLKEIRTFSNIPVIITSAKDMVSTKIDLLKLGADDYITKPFDLGELSARVETVLRRSGQEVEKEMFTYKDLKLDTADKRFFVKNQEIDLTAKEYLIMELMLENQEKIFTKAKIYETIWEEEYFGDDNTVKTHISNLRSKLKKVNPDEEYIETVWGLGYRLKKL